MTEGSGLAHLLMGIESVKKIPEIDFGEKKGVGL
jgi:hypothetical protein